jgi:uncharacterized protein
MSWPHRPLDRRSGLVLDTHDLGRRAGAMKLVRTTVEAPADLGIDVIGVPPSSPIRLDLRLESVVEGVLVSGDRDGRTAWECVRCPGATSDHTRSISGLTSIRQQATADGAPAGWRATCSTRAAAS